MFPPMGDDLGLGPAPSAPMLPEPVRPKALHPAAQAIMTAIAAAMGPGRGTGLLQGMQASQQQAQQQARQGTQDAYQQYQREQQMFQQEQQAYQAKQRAVADAVKALGEEAPNLTSRIDFDGRANAYASYLQGMGIRVSPQFLTKAVPYLEPTERDTVAKAVEKNQKLYPNAWKDGAPMQAHIQWVDPKTKQPRDMQIGQAIAAGLIAPPVDAAGKWMGAQPAAVGQDFTLSPGARRYDANGKLIASAPERPATAGPTKTPEKEWVIRNGQPTQIDKGTAQAGDRPYQANDAKLLSTADDVKSKRNTLATNALEAISELESASGVQGVFGAPQLTSPGSWTRIVGMDPIAGSASADAKVKLDRLLSLITLPELQNMRGLGAMSDTEFRTISKAATSLSSKMSDRAAAAELARLKKAFAEMQKNMVGTPVGDIGNGNGSVTVGGQTFGVQVVP